MTKNINIFCINYDHQSFTSHTTIKNAFFTPVSVQSTVDAIQMWTVLKKFVKRWWCLNDWQKKAGCRLKRYNQLWLHQQWQLFQWLWFLRLNWSWGDVSVIRKNCMNENDSYIKQCGHDNMTHTTVLTNNKVWSVLHHHPRQCHYQETRLTV